MRALLAACVLSGALLSDAPASEEDIDVAAARESLRRKIEAADIDGVIAVRGAEAARATPLSAPTLRDEASSPCLTLDSLLATEQALRPDAGEGLRAARAALFASVGAGQVDAERALARAYLALGFAEEARAIADALPGAEAAGLAGLALLAEGRADRAIAKVSAFKSCGAMYAFIDAAGRALAHNEALPDAARAVLARLPQALRAPIAEALAINAVIGADAAGAGLVEIAARPSSDPPSDARRFLDAVTDAEGDALRRLAPIAASPGPLRAPALQQIAKRLDDASSPESERAFEDNAEEETSRTPASAALADVSLALAERRAARGDATGAARALGAAFRHPATREAALTRFRRLAQALGQPGDPDASLAVLAMMAAEPVLAATSLEGEEFAAAANALADLGAAQTLQRVIAAKSTAAGDLDLALGRAFMRAGDLAAASAVAESHKNDARFDALRLALARARGDAKTENAIAARIGANARLEAAWRRGDLKAALATPHHDLDAAAAESLSLAYLAAGAAPPAALQAMKGAVPPPLFTRAPDASSADAGLSLQRFSQSIASELDYLKRALTP